MKITDIITVSARRNTRTSSATDEINSNQEREPCTTPSPNKPKLFKFGAFSQESIVITIPPTVPMSEPLRKLPEFAMTSGSNSQPCENRYFKFSGSFMFASNPRNSPPTASKKNTMVRKRYPPAFTEDEDFDLFFITPKLRSICIKNLC